LDGAILSWGQGKSKTNVRSEGDLLYNINNNYGRREAGQKGRCPPVKNKSEKEKRLSAGTAEDVFLCGQLYIRRGFPEIVKKVLRNVQKPRSAF
jgi:hypothetical protein